MLRIVLLTLSFLALSCSKHQPPPVAPAGKANCALCGFLGDGNHQAPEGSGGHTAPQDSTETETETDSLPADSTATTQTDDIEGPEEPVQVDSTSVVDSTSIEVLDDTQRFNIQLVFAPDIIEEDRQVFQDAARRWEEVIIGDLSDEEITDSVGSEWMDQEIKEGSIWIAGRCLERLDGLLYS